MLEFIKEQLGCTKATLFPIDYYTKDAIMKQAEKKNILHEINFVDENDALKA